MVSEPVYCQAIVVLTLLGTTHGIIHKMFTGNGAFGWKPIRATFAISNSNTLKAQVSKRKFQMNIWSFMLELYTMQICVYSLYVGGEGDLSLILR